MCFSDEVLSNVEVAIATSIVNWCHVIVISCHWVTVLFIDEVFYHGQVTVDGSIV